MMDISGSWQDWLFTLGYLSFALFVTWRVFASGK